MSKDLDKLLDKCIDRMNEGESLEECLASYPEQAKELEPLLRAMYDFRDTFSIMPRAAAKSVVRRRLDAALVESERSLRKPQRRPKSFFGWPRAWATVAIVLVLALIGVGLYWIFLPAGPPVVAQANFRLLLSDQENAIGDFEKLDVTITRIGMLRGGDEGGWQEITLDPGVVVDLTRLEGLNAQEIWGGIIPEGQYIQVFVYIEDAIGTLRNGETVNVIVPSGNLQISKPFVVTAGDSVVNFVYDVTVVAAGNEYILLPQVDQSGADREFHELGEGALTLWVVEVVDGELLPVLPGEVRPGESITVRVTLTLDGSPVEGAEVKVNGMRVGNTSGEAGLEGLISFTVPYDEKLKVKAKKINAALGELEGKLRIEFGPELDLDIDGEVAPGESITLCVTFLEYPVPDALVEVNDEEVGTTGDDGCTLPFTVPYDDELKIKAVKDELKGELKIDLEQRFGDELNLDIDGEVTPGESITILVTFLEKPVPGALVKVKDVGVFLTDGVGCTLPFTVPYDDELKIKAVKDELKGELKIDLEKELQAGNLTIQVVDGEVTPGESITILVTFLENPVEGALVKVEDVGVFLTDGDGCISFTVPYDDELDIDVEKGKLKGDLEIELQKGEVEIREAEEEEVEELRFEGIIETIDGTTWTMTIDGETRTVDVSEAEIEGEPAVGLEAKLRGTLVDDTIVASEVEIRED